MVIGPEVISPTQADMVGTWVVEAEGGVLAAASGPRERIHHKGEFSTLKGESRPDARQLAS